MKISTECEIEKIDSTPDEHKLACSECLEKLRISYDFKQSVICNSTVFSNYIDKLQCQHKSFLHLVVVLPRSKHRILPLTRDFTATTVENCSEKQININLKIHNEDRNLTSKKQEQRNTSKETNLKTENIDVVDPVTEEIHIKEEPFVDGITSNNVNEESKESEESNSTSNGCEYNDQPKQAGTKKRLYKCEECHKAFNTSSNLGRHRSIHRGEKPHQCDVCNKSFNQKSHLITHKRRHDNHTGKKPHQCHICQYKCRATSRLKNHMRTHSKEKPYQCQICKIKFSFSYNLKIHIRSHTGEKPFQCHICPFKCAYSNYLKIHIRSHTGEKPYQCHICQFKCANSGTLNNHMRIHSSEKP